MTISPSLILGRLLHVVVLAALAGSFLPTALSAAPEARCSKFVSWGPTLAPDGIYLLGTATGDSLVAGSAGVRFQVPEGAEDLGIRAQVVRVLDRLPRHTEGRAAVLAESDEVAIVWWDYRPDCSPLLWTNSILHAEPGVENVFRGQLRDREDWVDGIPTLDIHVPYHTPFPGAMHRRAEWAAERGLPDVQRRLLTGRELFDFLARLPVDADLARLPPHEFTREEEEAVLGWARDHPDRWGAEPVRALVQRARSQRQARHLPEEAHPLAGTYWLSIQWGDRAGEICLVTAAIGTGGLPTPRDYDAYAPAPWEESPPATVSLEARAARDCDAPAEEWIDAGVPIHVSRTPVREDLPDILETWKAALAPGILRSLVLRLHLPEEWRDILAADARRGGELALTVEEATELNHILTTARFLLHTDGRVTLEDRRGPDRFPFVVQGERIGDRTIP